jgi:hypothetical protein
MVTVSGTTLPSPSSIVGTATRLKPAGFRVVERLMSSAKSSICSYVGRFLSRYIVQSLTLKGTCKGLSKVYVQRTSNSDSRKPRRICAFEHESHIDVEPMGVPFLMLILPIAILSNRRAAGVMQAFSRKARAVAVSWFAKCVFSVCLRGSTAPER